MKDKKTTKEEKPAKDAAERGKKAIDAEKIAAGKNPNDPAIKKEEKKDAEHWRNEG